MSVMDSNYTMETTNKDNKAQLVQTPETLNYCNLSGFLTYKPADIRNYMQSANIFQDSPMLAVGTQILDI